MTKIIAEIGWNHMGDIDLAKKMIVAAKNNGADFVKTQIFDVNQLKKGPWDLDGRREIYQKASLTDAKYIQLKKFSDENNIHFFSSAFNKQGAERILKIDNNIFKVPSAEARNYELLDFVCKNFKKVLISTGTLYEKEIVELTKKYKNLNITLLHCVSAYPCPFENVNLSKIEFLKKINNNDAGFSDHSPGIEASILSLSYNPSYIEKHFTIDNNLPGRDNKFAILPNKLKRLKEYIEISNKIKINHGNDLQDCEQEVRKIYTGRWG